MYCKVRTTKEHCKVHTTKEHCKVRTTTEHCEVRTTIEHSEVRTTIEHCKVRTATKHCKFRATHTQKFIVRSVLVGWVQCRKGISPLLLHIPIPFSPNPTGPLSSWATIFCTFWQFCQRL